MIRYLFVVHCYFLKKCCVCRYFIVSVRWYKILIKHTSKVNVNLYVESILSQIQAPYIYFLTSKMEFSQFHFDVVAHSSYVHTRYTQSFRLTPEIELNVLLMAAMFRDIIFDKKKEKRRGICSMESISSR